jgi:hypothetical protein
MERMKAPALKKTVARKAIKSTAKHSAHGALAKARREPIRAVTLLGVGCLAGGVAGWVAARSAPAPG